MKNHQKITAINTEAIGIGPSRIYFPYGLFGHFANAEEFDDDYNK